TYLSADVVVGPSVQPEEFSLVAAEGQMRGLAAVVTGPGGVCEVIADGETGLVVAPNDVGALTDALRTLAEQPDLRAAMGVAGRKRMIERFSAQRYRSDLARVVAEAIMP
ncbi:MAG: glycosyltransferase family 4 protein, partial [Acidobacteria bacterium]|nr:glycosyltransferase family 4 protein [Acidobacteriota bacterium]